MNKIAAGLLFALGATATSTERFVLEFDNAAWSNLSLASLPENVVRVLSSLQMTVADLTAEELAVFENMPGVSVYRDEVIEAYGGVQENPKNWGIDRIDQRDLPLDKKFNFGAEGEGVSVYVVDTGVLPTHVEFAGRATQEKNFANDGKDYDCNGHGTHVASSIAGETVGIARKAKIHGVKVLNCGGSGTLSGVVSGIDYVANQQKANPTQKSVLNMSLGGRRNQALNNAAAAAVKSGVVVVVAAGNDGSDACGYSPASTPEAISVAASTLEDKYAYFTNYGTCTHVYAPGHQIAGAWIGTNDSYKTASGTSMASPHVAGVATLILSAGLAKTPEEVKAKLLEVATEDHIKPNRPNTPNKLLYADPSWTDKKSASVESFTSFRSLNNL